MVAGDLVNTASRVQSVAEPGTVFVGESTRRATEQTIVYEEAGSFELKGKEGLTPLWKALRVVSGLPRLAQVARARGAVRRPRPRAAADQGSLPRLRRGAARRTSSRSPASPASASRGSAGSSTSTSTASPRPSTGTAGAASPTARASPTGRSPTWCACAAGSPRTRSRPPRWRSCARRSRSTSSTPRSAASSSRGSRSCSGWASTRPATSRTCSPPGGSSSSGWPRATRPCSRSRTCSGRTRACSTSSSTCSTGRATHRSSWSRSRGRSCSSGGRPGARASGASPRSTWSRCPSEAMEELLTGLVPGLPPDVRDRILARAEGIPLYAVETVRMLLDRGLLVAGRRRAYRLTGPVEALEVPETLHALIAARLDGLSAEERRLLQDAAVLGKTFTQDALAALAGADDGARAAAHVPRAQGGARRAGRPALARARPVRLPPGPRPPRRLRDALEARAPGQAPRGGRAPERRFAADEDEVVEVIASHYLDAYEAAPDADDAAEIRGKAQAHARARRRARRVARRGRRGAGATSSRRRS